jgi:hypothetical protein
MPVGSLGGMSGSGYLAFDDDAFVPVFFLADAVLTVASGLGKEAHNLETTSRQRFATTSQKTHRLAELELV